jgi:hypothetical protein
MIFAMLAGCVLAPQAPPAFKLISPLPTALEKQRVLPTKEPSYAGSPRYGLLLIDGGKARVWFVVDGTKLYLDKNGNGDLTDDGPPLQTEKVEGITFPYVFFSWPSIAPRGTKAKLTEGNVMAKIQDGEYRIIDIRNVVDGVYWFYRNRGCVLATKASEAPILNLGEPVGLLFDFVNRTDGTLSKSKENDFFIQIGSHGSQTGSFLCRSYEDVPKDTYIEADFEFVDQRDPAKKLHLIAQLRTRC